MEEEEKYDEQETRGQRATSDKLKNKTPRSDERCKKTRRGLRSEILYCTHATSLVLEECYTRMRTRPTCTGQPRPPWSARSEQGMMLYRCCRVQLAVRGSRRADRRRRGGTKRRKKRSPATDDQSNGAPPWFGADQIRSSPRCLSPWPSLPRPTSPTGRRSGEKRKGERQRNGSNSEGKEKGRGPRDVPTGRPSPKRDAALLESLRSSRPLYA